MSCSGNRKKISSGVGHGPGAGVIMQTVRLEGSRDGGRWEAGVGGE